MNAAAPALGAAVGARAIDPGWLARGREPVLEPELPLVDAHHHLWRRPSGDYLWNDYLADADGHRLVASVFVECTTCYRSEGPEALRPAGESVFARTQGDAAASRGAPGVAAGIVAYADLALGAAVQEVLQAHVETAGPRLKGVRNSVAWHADASLQMPLRPPKRVIVPGMLALPALREGVRALGSLGLVFECWLYHPQIDELAALARACPGTTVVVDHLGGPLGAGPYAGRRDETFAEWRSALARLGACENVVLKFGGLGMRVSGLSHGVGDAAAPAASAALAAAWRPWFEACLATFGPARLMFESNFPMDKGAFPFGTVWNAFKRLSAGMGSVERDALLRATAARTYRLDV